MPKRIAVLGAIVYDEINTHDGRHSESFGGIVYNVAAFSSLVGDDAVVEPYSNVGADRHDAVLALLGDMYAVRTDGLRRWEGPLTHALLRYRDANEREEIVRHMMRPFTLADVCEALAADGIVLNFVNGTEIDLATLRALRSRTKAPLYLDMHNIMVRFDEAGKKHYLDFREWPDWVAQFDLVQMNEFECRTVLGGELSRPEDFLRAAHMVLGAGPRAVFVTMGPKGVAMAHRKDGAAYGCLIPPAPVKTFVDATGCGDAFSAGTFWNYLHTDNPLVAAMAGAIVGATNCTVRGIGRLEGARNAADRLAEISPELAEKALAGWPGDRLG